MHEPIHKSVPSGLLDDKVPSSARYRLGLLWIREVRRRNFLVPRSLILYFSASATLGALAYGDALPGRWYFFAAGLAMALFALFGRSRLDPDISEEEIEALSSMLRDEGYGELVDRIRHARD